MTLRISIQGLDKTGSRKQRVDAIARARAGHILALCLKADRLDVAAAHLVLQVGIVASKKQISKRAVDRNTVKRRVRAALRDLDQERLAALAESKRLGQLRILLVCSRESLTEGFDKIKENINSSLLRLLTALKPAEEE